ncbi:MAG: 30S ribosomal protein S1 [Deltaproteobacteria bacterium]|nr:30S ribosomal protein S1 [Deltaproteobacteria bacterium]
MPDDSSRVEEPEEKSFAELMEAYEKGREGQIRVGDKIHGKIISIGKDAVFVDTGTKVDGVVEKGELLDEEGALPFKVGDALDLYVVSSSGDELRLSRAASRNGGFPALRTSYERAVPVEGKVKGVVKGGFHVEIMKRRAFCPMGQIDVVFTETPEDHVGKTYLFVITQLEEGGRNIVVSRREILRAEQAKAREVFCRDLQVGALYDAKVTRLMPYGVFVALAPGVEGMVHVSELSWSRLEKPDEAVQRDDVLRVKVIGVERDGSPGQVRIALSAKQVSPDPWESVTERFRHGDKVKGKVKRCTKFGAFVEIEPGIEGLVHISEMSYRRRVVKPEEVVRPGELVEVLIKEIEASRRRVSLSIRDVEGDPWADAEERFCVGQSVLGTVERKEPFGWFVSLEPGITGLVPKSRITESGAKGNLEGLREGDPIKVLIEAIRPQERRISLGLSDQREEAEWRGYAGAGGGQTLGSLGEKLQDAFKSRKDVSKE